MKNVTLRYLRDLLLCAILILSVNSLLAAPGNLDNTLLEKHEPRETIVYITKTGKKYHKDGCRYLSQSKIKTTLKKAVAGGLEACKVCKP